jgi:hypothetical protein
MRVHTLSGALRTSVWGGGGCVSLTRNGYSGISAPSMKTSLNDGPFLGAFAKLRKATVSFVMSVCPHGTTRLSLDGF